MDIKCLFSSELSLVDVNNYSKIIDSVFGNFSGELFKKKYMRNIYGDSLFVFAFIDDECVGVQVFWRNDTNGIKAFQSCDSGVLPGNQGRGIFTCMVRKGIEVLGNDSIIYGFPNSKSLPSFLKMGWKEIYLRKSSLFFPHDIKKIDIIDDGYLNWMLEKPNNHCYCTLGKWILILSYRRYHCYQIVGRTNNTRFVLGMKKVFFPVLIFHNEKGKIGKGNRLISLSENKSAFIPDYKIDVELF